MVGLARIRTCDRHLFGRSSPNRDFNRKGTFDLGSTEEIMYEISWAVNIRFSWTLSSVGLERGANSKASSVEQINAKVSSSSLLGFIFCCLEGSPSRFLFATFHVFQVVFLDLFF